MNSIYPDQQASMQLSVMQTRLTHQKIVQVHSADRGGGAEAVVRMHHQEMRRQGYDSLLWVARMKGDDEAIREIEYVRGPKGLRRLARWYEQLSGRQYVYSPSFRKLLKALPDYADVVHLHSLHGAEGYADIYQLAQLSQQVPVAITAHDLWLLTGHCAHPLECGRWQTGCGQCPDLARYPPIPHDGTHDNWANKRRIFEQAKIHLIAPSKWVIQQIEQSPILSHFSTSLVYNPLDTSIFFPADKQLARQRLGLPAEKKIVLMVAQHLSNLYKGVKEGIAALNQVTDPDLFVVTVGGHAQKVLQQCRAPGKAIPYQANPASLADFYRAADVFIMPSRCETFGMVAAESMACGTPVVAFSVGGLTDVIAENEGGILVPSEDSSAMASAIQHLLEDDEKRLKLGSIAESRAHREFSLTTHTHRCLTIYQQLIEQFNRPSISNFMISR